MKAGWRVKNLGDVCNLIGGGTPSKDNADFYTGNIPWATVRDMRSDVITDTEHKITEAAIKNSSTNIIPSGSVIIATRVGLGKVCLLNQDTAINQDLRGIFPKDEAKLSTRFLFWWLKSVADVIVAEGTGATVQGVKLPFVKSLQIPLPPLPEQQRIVAILDEAFAAIAAARANAEQNSQNARALFESYLQSVFSQRGEGWVETTIGNQVDFLAGFAFKSTQYTESKDGIRLIRGDNIVQGQLRWDGVKYLPRASAENYSQFYFEENDIVLAMDRPWVAAGLKVACITNNDLPALQVQRTARLRVKPNIHWKYLFHMIRSSKFVTYLLDGQTGLGVPHISGKQILSFEFAMPPLNQQQLIVQKLDALDDKTQRLESLYQRKIAALDELKQSLLQQAFSGQL